MSKHLFSQQFFVSPFLNRGNFLCPVVLCEVWEGGSLERLFESLYMFKLFVLAWPGYWRRLSGRGGGGWTGGRLKSRKVEGPASTISSCFYQPCLAHTYDTGRPGEEKEWSRLQLLFGRSGQYALNLCVLARPGTLQHQFGKNGPLLTFPFMNP
jgi:hypothetical protein